MHEISRISFSMSAKAPMRSPRFLEGSALWMVYRYPEAIFDIPVMPGGLNWSMQHHLI
jgi:hypothetical protein